MHVHALENSFREVGIALRYGTGALEVICLEDHEGAAGGVPSIISPDLEKIISLKTRARS